MRCARNSSNGHARTNKSHHKQTKRAHKARRRLRRRLRRSHCKNHPEWVDIDMLAAYAEAPPAGHIIDDPRVHLAEARTFSFGPSSQTKELFSRLGLRSAHA